MTEARLGEWRSPVAPEAQQESEETWRGRGCTVVKPRSLLAAWGEEKDLGWGEKKPSVAMEKLWN